MEATDPTTRPAHSALEFRERLPDTDIPRLHFLAGRNPAYPLVARERRDIVPERPHRRRRHNGVSKVGWQLVHRTARDSFVIHRTSAWPASSRFLIAGPR